MICDCGHEATPNGIAAGYGISPDGKTACYECCGQNEKQDMLATGRASLYLCCKPLDEWKAECILRYGMYRPHMEGSVFRYHITNWPGTLKFPLRSIRLSEGVGFGRRYPVRNVSFIGPDEKLWFGRNAGDNEILNCRRSKQS